MSQVNPFGNPKSYLLPDTPIENYSVVDYNTTEKNQKKKIVIFLKENF